MPALRSWSARAATLLAAVLALGVLAGPAAGVADPSDEGLWYATQTSIPTVHEVTRGAGMTIAVIDGPINPDAPDLVGTDLVTHDGLCANADGSITPGTSTEDAAEHATAVVSLLIGTGTGVGGRRGVLGVAPEARVLHYNMVPAGWVEGIPANQNPTCYIDGLPLGDVVAQAAAIDLAVAEGADIISISSTGASDVRFGDALARAYQAGVILVAGVNNVEGEGLGFPADANGAIAVEMVGPNAELIDPTMVNEYLTILAPGAQIRVLAANGGAWDTYEIAQGSSFATPFVAGALALAWSVHPQATANQMIQSLIRNTGDTPDHEPVHDDTWGYGTISTKNLLTIDPTGYPDVNPLLRPFTDEHAIPSTELILGHGPEPTETPEPTGEPTVEPTAEPTTPAPDPGTASTFPVLPVALGVGALLLVAGLATAVLRARRPASPPTTPNPPTA
ncbi:S8 family serine peptidase [Cellulomonas sp. KRMCY2]|uniref:S8 family serine peptidase n=1 Tax=Cellulomonas sp. KRMCY2 TaxID=1304865 RepID=UPI00045E7262|nr:S8 family serine peptidase [Cellulomonas sp. KRMCY2]